MRGSHSGQLWTYNALTADVGTGLGTGCHFSGLRGLTRSHEKAGLREIMPT